MKGTITSPRNFSVASKRMIRLICICRRIHQTRCSALFHPTSMENTKNIGIRSRPLQVALVGNVSESSKKFVKAVLTRSHALHYFLVKKEKILHSEHRAQSLGDPQCSAQGSFDGSQARLRDRPAHIIGEASLMNWRMTRES